MLIGRRAPGVDGGETRETVGPPPGTGAGNDGRRGPFWLNVAAADANAPR